MIDNSINDIIECKMQWLDDIFIGTKESQGIRNATNAIKFVLFDDESVLPDGIKFNNKYEFISARRDGRQKAKDLTKIDLIEILAKYAMESFGIKDEYFAVTYQEYDDIKQGRNLVDFSGEYAVNVVAYAMMDSVYGAYTLLANNKMLRLKLVDNLITERYIENKMLMLDRFDGNLVNDNISFADKKKYLDNFKDLEYYFLNIKKRDNEYLAYLDGGNDTKIENC